MFDKHFSFRYCSRNKEFNSKGQYHIFIHILTFNCKKNHQYIVQVEQYPHQIYILKFYQKNHRLSPKKYGFKTGHQQTSLIINTCIEIMGYFLKRNPTASFGFIGAQSDDEKSPANTKRFALYSKIMLQFFSPANFTHLSYTQQSAYLMLNRKNTQPNLVIELEHFFTTNYLLPNKES